MLCPKEKFLLLILYGAPCISRKEKKKKNPFYNKGAAPVRQYISRLNFISVRFV